MTDPVPVEDQRILTRRDGAVAHIVFNNPARHNAMSLAMWQGLSDHLVAFGNDDDVRVVVLSGAGGRAFVSGADISEFETRRGTPEAVAEYNRISEAAEAAVGAFAKPIIAMIDGYCLGGGVGIATGCDMRICSDTSRFGIPAARLGLGYAFAGIAKLAALVGPANVAEIFMTGERFDAATAARMGLVNRVVPSDRLAEAVDTLAQQIACNAPLTLAALKAALAELAKPESIRDTARVDRMVRDCYASDDYAEGRAAFAERRPPVFRGR